MRDKKGPPTRATLLALLYGTIDLIFSQLDCRCSTYRSYARFLFSIAKSDFPSPTNSLKQLNDGVFYSFIFHEISSA
jgi:hypothetical protein